MTLCFQIIMLPAPAVLWILSALICVGRSHHHIGHGEAGQDTAADESDNKIQLVASANKEFAFHLYRKLADHASSQGKNIFFSPVSVSSALAALSVGARGETHQQLFSGLGFSSSQLAQTDVDRAFRALFANAMSHKDISQGSAVFVDNLFKPKPEFLDALKQSYAAEGFSLEFAKSAESADTINQYVSDKTNGKINELVESLDPNTVMYLLSYIYYKGKSVHATRSLSDLFHCEVFLFVTFEFIRYRLSVQKGKWETPFDPQLTREDVFRVEENNEVRSLTVKYADQI